MGVELLGIATDPAIVRLLVEAGASVNETSGARLECTPLWHAYYNKNEAVGLELLRCGASPNILAQVRAPPSLA